MHRCHFPWVRTAAVSAIGYLFFLVVSGLAAGVPAAAQSLDVILILDTSPGTEQSTDRIRAKSFGERDRAGLVGAAPPARLLLPLTDDKTKLADGLHRASLRAGGTIGNVSITQLATVDLAGAISEACNQFREAPPRSNKRVILVVFAGEDRALPAAAERLAAQIDAVQAKLFAILVTRTPGPARSAPPLGGVPLTIAPVLTTNVLADLAKQSGGRIYKQAWDMKEVLKEAMRN